MIPSFRCSLAGVLNFREFVTGLSLSLRGSFDEKLYWSFNIYDVDGNGFISREEMNEIIAVSREWTLRRKSFWQLRRRLLGDSETSSPRQIT